MGSLTSKEDYAASSPGRVRGPGANSAPLYGGMPIPDEDELEERFNSVLKSLDLPKEQEDVVKRLDSDKKWEMVQQERLEAKASPEMYLRKLEFYLGSVNYRTHKKQKDFGGCTSTQVLKHLETSLRTNHIQWVYDFLNDSNNGLDVLIRYLYFSHVSMSLAATGGGQAWRRYQQRLMEKLGQGDSLKTVKNGEDEGDGSLGREVGSLRRDAGSKTDASVSRAQVMSRTSILQRRERFHMGDPQDDVHVCIMCLRAIMNSNTGFNKMFGHKDAVNCIALSLSHIRPRTKTLVLELLSALCLVEGGHEKVLQAFDFCRDLSADSAGLAVSQGRFYRLIQDYMNFDEFDIDYMVACMRFINILANTPVDMNYRVYLQSELSVLGLGNYLQRLLDQYGDNEALTAEVQVYLENLVDVSQLLDDSLAKEELSKAFESLVDKHSRLTERHRELEEQSLVKITELEKSLLESQNKFNEMEGTVREQNQTLKVMKKTQSELEAAKAEALLKVAEAAKPVVNHVTPLPRQNSSTPPVPPPISSIPPLAPPIAVPPPLIPPMGVPIPPPPPGLGVAPLQTMPLKQIPKPGSRLPRLTWSVLPPPRVKGTIFQSIDDEHMYKVIPLGDFEDLFRLDEISGKTTDSVDYVTLGSSQGNAVENATVKVLDDRRCQNLALAHRRVEAFMQKHNFSIDMLISFVSDFDLGNMKDPEASETGDKTIVDFLAHLSLTDDEIAKYRAFRSSGRKVSQLMSVEQFLMHVAHVERFSERVLGLQFMQNFEAENRTLQNQLNCVIAASMALKNSKKLGEIFALILALGNYMNSDKHGRAAYGFSLSSLDKLTIAAHQDREQSLIHFLARVVHDKLPRLLSYDADCQHVEKASKVPSLNELATDVSRISERIAKLRREYESRESNPMGPPQLLGMFLQSNSQSESKLKTDLATAKEYFQLVTEHFGENSTQPCDFFGIFARFNENFRRALSENDARLQAQARKSRAQERRRNTRSAADGGRPASRGDRQLLKREDMEERGGLDRILLGMKEEPLRRTDIYHRNRKRQTEVSGGARP